MQVKTKAIERAIKLLDAANCKYLIVDDEGQKFGVLSIAEPKAPSKRAPGKYPVGTFKAYYKPLVSEIKAGEAAVVPYGPFASTKDDREALRGALCSWCSANWGLKTYISSCTKTGIELLRFE